MGNIGFPTPEVGPAGGLPALPSPCLLDDLSAEARSSLLADAEWLGLPGGQILFEEGDASDALYLVVTGALAVLAGRPIERARVIARVTAGETVGEMGILSDRPRTATVAAMRDATLLRIDKRAMERLVRRHPETALRLLRQLVDWLEQTTSGMRARYVPRSIALVGIGTDVETEELARRLAAAIAGTGTASCVIGSADGISSAERLHAVEAAHDHVIYAGSTWGDTWTSLCVRQADRLLLVAAGAAAACVPPAAEASPSLPWRTADLVLLARNGVQPAAAPWLDRVEVRCHHHLRWSSAADLARLARALTGSAVGLVLSGGGARGFGHIGVLRALRAGGIPIDAAGGTSIGAVIAAGIALEWDDDEFDRRMRAAFVESDPLDDYTIPLVAVARGRKVDGRLREHFGEVSIEDLRRPLFCVASDLTNGEPAVLRRGPLWRALRAALAIPGLLPPAIHAGRLLVDGAVLNNLPADIAEEVRLGPILGVDVTRYRTIGPAATPRARSVVRLLRRWLLGGYEGPGIATLLMSAANMGSDAQTRQSRASLDALLEPPVHGIHIRDWRAYDRAVEIGYRHAMERMDELRRALLPGGRGDTG